MHISTFVNLAIIMLSAVKASPASNDNYYVYATFYDDTACTDNPGEAVSTSNAGCLANEYNRHSIYFQAGFYGGASLVWSPGNDCNCQNDCVSGIATGDAYCYDMTGQAPATSFRFIEQTCGDNNCPTS